MRTLVLDSGAFIAAEKFDRTLATIIKAAADAGADIVVPATVVAEIWRTPPRANNTALLKTATAVHPLDERSARAVGVLLTKDSSLQLVDANVAAIAIGEKPSLVVTSDPADIHRLVTVAGETCSLRAASGSSSAVVVATV